MQDNALTEQERDAVANAMRYGLELHRKGILDQAEALYSGVLKLAPRHGEALSQDGHARGSSGAASGRAALDRAVGHGQAS